MRERVDHCNRYNIVILSGPPARHGRQTSHPMPSERLSKRTNTAAPDHAYMTKHTNTPSLSTSFRPHHNLARPPAPSPTSSFARSRYSLRRILPDCTEPTSVHRPATAKRGPHCDGRQLTGFLSIASTNTTPPASRLCGATRFATKAATSAGVTGSPAPGEATTYARGSSEPSLSRARGVSGRLHSGEGGGWRRTW